jgi:predicted DNA-binding protein
MKYNEYEEKWKNRPIRMPDELWDKLKVEAKKEKMFISEYIRHILGEKR